MTHYFVGSLVLSVLACGPSAGPISFASASRILVASEAQPTSRRVSRKVLPRNDALSEPSFYAFQSALLAAAERGDVPTLRAALAPDIKLGFDASNPDEVLRVFNVKPGSPWKALRQALRLGAVREADGGFIAPYVSGSLTDDLESGELVITGAGVRVREQPHPTAVVVETLAYEVVLAGDDYGTQRELFEDADSAVGLTTWVRVVTPSGIGGYVLGRYVRSPGDVRFYFKRVEGVWKVWAINEGFD